MRLLTIVGKVDTRVLAYPISRALSLTGSTALISDDGAYRRLYNGEELQGTVSGVDISVGVNTDEVLRHSLDASGVVYDNIVLVSSSYIPSDSNGVIVCHGSDRSMMGLTEKEKEEMLEEERSKADSGKKHSNKKESAEAVTEAATEAATEEVNEGTSVKLEKPIIEQDIIEIPNGIPSVEVQISYSTPSYKGLTSILLKDSFMNYIYSCEERKELMVYPDKAYNKVLAKILNTTLNIDMMEALKLLERTEYLKSNKN